MGIVKFKNVTTITLDTIKAMVSSGAVKISADSMTSTNGAVEVRVSFNLASAVKDLNLYARTVSETAKARKALFEKWFSNKIRVISLEQKDTFGMIVNIAAKVDLTGFNMKELHFYSYNATTNQYKRIYNPNYWVDSNGYLRFETALAGDIIISEGALKLK